MNVPDASQHVADEQVAQLAMQEDHPSTAALPKDAPAGGNALDSNADALVMPTPIHPSRPSDSFHLPSSSMSISSHGAGAQDDPLIRSDAGMTMQQTSEQAHLFDFPSSAPSTMTLQQQQPNGPLKGGSTNAGEFGALGLSSAVPGTAQTTFATLLPDRGLPTSNTFESIAPTAQQKGPYQQLGATSPAYGNGSYLSGSGSTAFSSLSSGKRAPYKMSNSGHTVDMRTVVADPSLYGEKLFPAYNHGFHDGPEDDDELHNPDPKWVAGREDASGTIFTKRGLLNIGTLIVVASSLLMLFAGYPILVYVFGHGEGNKGGYNLGGSNATGQVPSMAGLPSLIDKDTPEEVYQRMSLDGSKRMKLVFSDEFNLDGRSFYPGDDPFWEAVDLHYWGTGNYEWYDPAAITTEGGNMVITLSETPDHNLNFRGGMVTTWNKMCFTGGYIEVRVVLPGSPDISGLWPAAWTMGNLGRAGYGATTDGMWPYSYDSCDVGTLANQSWPASMGGGPVAAETTGVFVDQYGPGLSYLPGQRLSRCTCPNEREHPGPKHPDGSYVGRSAPEIDIIEAQASSRRGRSGHVSMSMQLAPYDAGYNLTTEAGAYDFFDPDAILNTYTGSVYQQAASGIITTEDSNYVDSGMVFDTYGFEYKPGGEDDSFVTWTKGNREMWRLHSRALGPNPETEIGQRLIPPEPMYVILNLGISSSFSYVDFANLRFPSKYYIDYVRVWQPEDAQNLGCDPPEFPTQDYITNHWEAYNNPNLTIWDGTRAVGGFGQPFPKNRLIDTC